VAKVQGEVGGGWPRFRGRSEVGGQGSGRGGWPRFRGRWVAKVQGEMGGHGSERRVAKVQGR
jgi:hypothetical protein